MQNVKNILLLGLLAGSLTSFAGCSTITSFFGGSDDDKTAVAVNDTIPEDARLSIVGQSPDSLANYKLGRGYAAAGRYELAREHYLLALASANTRDLRSALSEELESVDLMIKSLR